jgi:hypothetical protein
VSGPSIDGPPSLDSGAPPASLPSTVPSELVAPPELVAPSGLVAPPEPTAPPERVVPPKTTAPPVLVALPDPTAPPELAAPSAPTTPPELVVGPETATSPDSVVPPTLPPVLVEPPDPGGPVRPLEQAALQAKPATATTKTVIRFMAALLTGGTSRDGGATPTPMPGYDLVPNLKTISPW